MKCASHKRHSFVNNNIQRALVTFPLSIYETPHLHTMVLISIPTTVADRTQTATTLATCVDTKSTVMLEFQGMIEMDGQTWAGNALGQLSILDGVCTDVRRQSEGRINP